MARTPPTVAAGRVLDAITVLGLLAGWGTVVVFWSRLPEHVPQHFDLAGRPDAWGGRGAALIGPVGATLITFILLLIERGVRHGSVQAGSDPEARRRLTALQALGSVRAVLALVTAWSTFQQCRVAMGEVQGLGVWSVLSVLLLLLVPMVIWARSRGAERGG